MVVPDEPVRMLTRSDCYLKAKETDQGAYLFTASSLFTG